MKERTHTTVCVNKYSLIFADAKLEESYQSFLHNRTRNLWLRSLIPAAAMQILFACGDFLQFPSANFAYSLPARMLLAISQLGIFTMVKLNLINTRQNSILIVNAINGISTLFLYSLQLPYLRLWDVLFLLYGLMFYTIPKITALGYIHSFTGSWLATVTYFYLAFFIRPPPLQTETILSFFLCAPVVVILNIVSYYSEYSYRERFVLRERLNKECISLAVSRTSISNRFQEFFGDNSGEFNGKAGLVGMIIWGIFTLGGWTSLPESLKFVDATTGWAWFSHIAGVTIFLVIVTRNIIWLFVAPIIGSVLLWLLSLMLSSRWIILSAHSFGYSLLGVSAIFMLGVFSRFVYAWQQLVNFLRRTCFLYPQLQDGLRQDYPLLEQIISDYTAGMKPDQLVCRLSPVNTRHHLSNIPADHERDVDALTKDSNQQMMSILPANHQGTCLFCQNNNVAHFIPVCSRWGKWAHWRVENDSLVHQAKHGAKIKMEKPVKLCTAYSELQIRNSELEEKVKNLECQVLLLKKNESKLQVSITNSNKYLMESNTMLQLLKEEHTREINELNQECHTKITSAITENNQAIHVLRSQVKKYEKEMKQVDHAACTQNSEITELKAECDRLTSIISSRDSTCSSYEVDIQHMKYCIEKLETELKESNRKSYVGLSTLTSRRLPYAQSLEIEGIKESVKKRSLNSHDLFFSSDL